MLALSIVNDLCLVFLVSHLKAKGDSWHSRRQIYILRGHLLTRDLVRDLVLSASLRVFVIRELDKMLAAADTPFCHAPQLHVGA